MHRCLLLVAALTFTALPGCGAPAPDDAAPTLTERGTFRVEIAVRDGGFRRGVNAFTVRAWDAQGVEASVAEVVAEMPSHDHERSVANITATDEGFAVDDLRLTMPGRWTITLRVAQGARSDVALVSTFIP